MSQALVEAWAEPSVGSQFPEQPVWGPY